MKRVVPRVDPFDRKAGQLPYRIGRKSELRVERPGTAAPKRESPGGFLREFLTLFGGKQPRIEENIQFRIGLAGEKVVEQILAIRGSESSQRCARLIKRRLTQARIRNTERRFFIEKRGDFRPKRRRILDPISVQRRKRLHLFPEPCVIEPAAHTEVHPPRSEIAQRTFRRIAPEQTSRPLTSFRAFPPAGKTGLLGQKRSGIVFIEPHFSGERDAFGGGHCRGRAPLHPIMVGDRGAENIDIR